MRRVINSSMGVVLSFGMFAAASGRELSFEQRVKAQEAIERVSYAHQIGAVRPFEQAVPRSALERKVSTYLAQSAALESLWKTPLTGDMLARELERMAASSRSPMRLRELFAALGNDPFLIQECLCRATLADRLVRASFGSDDGIQASARAEAEDLRRGLVRFGVERFADDPRRSVVEIARAGGADGAEVLADELGARRTTLNPEAFGRWRSTAPARAGQVGEIRSEREAFVISTVLDERDGWARIANFTVRKRSFAAWWVEQRAAFETSSVRPVASESPSLAIRDIASGSSNAAVAAPSLTSSVDGDDAWEDGSLDDVSHGRIGAAKVWTGSVMAVWGGYNDGVLNTGGLYAPATDSWTEMSSLHALPSSESLVADWTGGEVVLRGKDRTGSGIVGRYDIAADRWSTADGQILKAPKAVEQSTAPARIAAPGSAPISDVSFVPPPSAPAPGPSPDQPGSGPLSSASGGQSTSNQEFPPVSVNQSGLFFPTDSPVGTQIFAGTQAAYFGYCAGGPAAGTVCLIDAACPSSYCDITLDNTYCLSYNMSCAGARMARTEYGFADVLETTYDSSPSPGRQTWIERNSNYISPNGVYWRPYNFTLNVDANSTCVGGTNAGAYCTVGDAAGICTGGGTCTGQPPAGGATWTFTPNNRNGNTSLLLRWPWVAVNQRDGTDPYWQNGFSTWMRSSDFNPGSSSSGAQFTTYLDHANDRRGVFLNALYSIVDFNATAATAKVGNVNAGYFDARISGPTASRVIGGLTGVRSEVNLLSTGGPQPIGPSYGLFVQFNPTGTGIAADSYTGILINTPAALGSGTTIARQDGLSIADQQLAASGSDGSAIVVASQTTSRGSQGNIKMEGANWNSGHVQLATGHLWRDATSGVLRYKNAAVPTKESDGSSLVMGTASASHGVVLWGVGTSADPAFDTGDEVCAASGLTCVNTAEYSRSGSIACSVTHAGGSGNGNAIWLAFCK